MPKSSESSNIIAAVIIGFILIMSIFFIFRKKNEGYTIPPPRTERVANVLGRIEEVFHLKGIPQSENVPEMAVGFGVGPGILGNMRNPTEGIYLGPNTGIF